ncbi:MAG: dephospho-CoA kinase [Firmicutes bacterium]|nr:dephospho-CoA kinase [Bacillota bacterium]
MLVIGLTGGIATGKSTVATLFEKRGVHRIDTDQLARSVVEPGQIAWDAIVQYFGNDILQENGQLNRKKLGKLIFADAKKRRVLENIIHPAIQALMNRQINEARRQGVCITLIEVPLLYETNFHNDVDRVIVVTATEEKQVARLLQRDGLAGEQARQRMASQLPLAEKVARADYVIDNNGTLEQTEQQVDAVWQIVKQECVHGKHL